MVELLFWRLNGRETLICVQPSMWSRNYGQNKGQYLTLAL